MAALRSLLVYASGGHDQYFNRIQGCSVAQITVNDIEFTPLQQTCCMMPAVDKYRARTLSIVLLASLLVSRETLIRYLEVSADCMYISDEKQCLEAVIQLYVDNPDSNTGTFRERMAQEMEYVDDDLKADIVRKINVYLQIGQVL